MHTSNKWSRWLVREERNPRKQVWLIPSKDEQIRVKTWILHWLDSLQKINMNSPDKLEVRVQWWPWLRVRRWPWLRAVGHCIVLYRPDDPAMKTKVALDYQHCVWSRLSLQHCSTQCTREHGGQGIGCIEQWPENWVFCIVSVLGCTSVDRMAWHYWQWAPDFWWCHMTIGWHHANEWN